MRRREFITFVASATAAWPIAAYAQQQTIPVIGFLSLGSPESNAVRLTGLRRGLNESGYVEGRDFVFEYRGWPGNQADLPAMAAELVHIPATVIVTTGPSPTLAAKAATTSIPIVFSVGSDPVQLGLVASLNRPGGNLTGSNVFVNELGAKELALLHELVPSAATLGFLENPNDPISELTMRDVLATASVMGLKVQVFKAATDREIDAAFANLVQAQIGALLVGNAYLFNELWKRFHGALPFARRIRRPDSEGQKPADLPVQQATKVELVINLKTAKTLGLAIPLPLLGRADLVIE